SLYGALHQNEFLTSSGKYFFTLLTPFAVLGIIITAGYMLIMVRKVFMGPLNERWSALKDMDTRELVGTLPLIFLMIFIGIYPNPLINLFQQSVNQLVTMTRAGASVPPIMF
ncbi:MAG: hypothetical protein ABIC40_03480, partial [bacterium]